LPPIPFAAGPASSAPSSRGRQPAPEGFYTVDAKALNPASRFHRSFNLGFPNVFDRTHNRTGSFVMVHGAAPPVGCFAMTDPVVDEIWRLATAALKGGQKRFHVHVFPFRMTEENLARREAPPWAPFWRDLSTDTTFRGDAAASAHRRLRRGLHLRAGATGKRRQPRDRQCVRKLDRKQGLDAATVAI
jgi:hypothetical protein